MALTFRKLHPLFVGEVSPVDLRRMHDEETLARIRAGMDEFAVLVFRNQPFADNEHLEFAQRLDGVLHTKLGISALQKNRLGNEALGDISNLDEKGDLVKSDNRRRMYSLGNRLWHTDASFQDPPGRYSMLSAKVVPPCPRIPSTPTCGRRTTPCPQRRRHVARGCGCTTPSPTRGRPWASIFRRASRTP